RLPAVTTLVPEGQPATAPHPAGQASCLRIAPGGAVSLAAGTAGTGTVSVEAGLGGLVVAGRAGADPGTAYSLITDAGIRYPVENAEVAGLLGYPVQAAAVVPPGVLDLIPAGPALALDRIKG
ncbi:MAG TPA: type VII secretion protein EccB, partial [Actinoplanes sp.]|nr:type VII secretion protein EccB [Actinoplanes sp.]